jgi:imidazolonepropionase-like amidohydrolase
MEAILTATRNAAEAIDVLDDLGTVEAGKLADLIVVDGNPLDDVALLQDIRRIKLVVKNGSVMVDRRA